MSFDRPGRDPRRTTIWLRRALLALVVAAFASAFSGDLPNSPYTDVAVAAVDLLGLLFLGFSARWSSIWIFSVALILVTTIHEHFFWPDKPEFSSMDDIGPTGIVLALPIAWVLLALGAAARSRLDRPTDRSPAPAQAFR